MIITLAVLTARVLTGAAYADAHLGRWWEVVDPDTLDMEDAMACVLGQLSWDAMVAEEDYVDVPMWCDVARRVFPDDPHPCDYAVSLGFDGPDGTHEQLTQLWRAEITRRRHAA